MNRFHVALSLDDTQPLSKIASSIQAAQREIFDSKGGSPQVRDDPAVQLMVHAMCHHLDVSVLNTDFTAYSQLTELVSKRIATPEAGDVAPRRWNDAESAQGGAVNVGAMAGSIARYASQLEVAGQDTCQDVALRMIAHQIASLCKAGYEAAPELGGLQHACRSAVAAQVAHAVVEEAAPKASPPSLAP